MTLHVSEMVELNLRDNHSHQNNTAFVDEDQNLSRETQRPGPIALLFKKKKASKASFMGKQACWANLIMHEHGYDGGAAAVL